MNNKLVSLLTAGLVLFVGLTAGLANTISYNFAAITANGNLGTPKTFTVSGYNLTASGFNADGTTQALWGKHSGTGEEGLGLATGDSADHEIEFDDFIQLDVLSLVNHGASQITITLGSLQNAESGSILRTNTAGTTSGSTLIKKLTGGAVVQSWTFNINASNRYIDIIGGGGTVSDPGDVILTAASATIPDGGSTAILLGMGVLCFGLSRRRRVC
jgi:hypothetical protein